MAGGPSGTIELPDQPMVRFVEALVTQLLVLLLTPGHHCCQHLLSTLQDCCFSGSAPLLATALVNGQVMLHRYQQETARPASAAATTRHHQDHTSHQQDECSTSYYSTAEVLNRRSKQGASCGHRLCVGRRCSPGLWLQDWNTAAAGRCYRPGDCPPFQSPSSWRQSPPHLGPPALSGCCGDDSGGLNIWDVRSGQSVYSYGKHTDFITGQQLA